MPILKVVLVNDDGTEDVLSETTIDCDNCEDQMITMTTQTALNVRSRPNTNSNIRTTLANNTDVIVNAEPVTEEMLSGMGIDPSELDNNYIWRLLNVPDVSFVAQQTSDGTQIFLK